MSFWLLWRFIYLLVGKDYWLLPSLEVVMVPSNTMNFCLQRRDIKISSCSEPLPVSEVRAVFNKRTYLSPLGENQGQQQQSGMIWESLEQSCSISQKTSFHVWYYRFCQRASGSWRENGRIVNPDRIFHLYLYTYLCLLQILLGRQLII